MPTATPFTALGAGNGFPYCIPQVDVDNFDHWTTLSGVNKNDPTASDSLIADSFQLAMKLYWNLFEVYGEASVYRFNPYDGGSVITDIEVSNADTSDSDYDEPMHRVCGAATGENSEFDNGLVRINFTAPSIFALMYNGELVGYSAGPTEGFARAQGYASGGTSSNVLLYGSVEDEVEKTYEYFSNPENVELEYDYIELNGMSFVCYALADGGFLNPDYTTLTVDASSASASAAYSFPIPEEGTDTRNSSASITGTDFYTY